MLELNLVSNVKISVIIPTFNEEKIIEKCLRGIHNQTHEDWELIVVDGGSTDRTISLAEEQADQVIIDGIKNVGHSRNLGAMKASGEVFAFLDGDSIPSKTWLEKIEECFNSDDDIGAAGGPILPLSTKKLYRYAYWWPTSSVVKFCVNRFNFGWFSGTNAVYARTTFRKSGGFAEEFDFSEDILLSLRASKLTKVGYHHGLVYTSVRRLNTSGIHKVALFYLVNAPLTLLGRPINKYPKIR